jgi:two-component sensor histidine kinase
VPIDVAIPLGLILNELVSNALKHAFPGERKGSIDVLLCEAGQERITLTVRDDGIGLPAGVRPGETQSLGLELVATLIDQLDAELTVLRSDGTEFRISFPNGRSRATTV